MVRYRIESPTWTVDNVLLQSVGRHCQYHVNVFSNPRKVLRRAQSVLHHGRSMSAPPDVPNARSGSGPGTGDQSGTHPPLRLGDRPLRPLGGPFGGGAQPTGAEGAVSSPARFGRTAFTRTPDSSTSRPRSFLPRSQFS